MYSSMCHQTDDMIEQLASLLLPIDALLAHHDFVPHINPPATLVALFRNMWCLSVLFHFTIADEEQTAMDWQLPALARIAAKTPSMVMEEPNDSIASDVEYNSVIRQEYASTVCSNIFTSTPTKCCIGYFKTSLILDAAYLPSSK